MSAHTIGSSVAGSSLGVPASFNYTPAAGATILTLSIVASGTASPGGSPTFAGKTFTQAGPTQAATEQSVQMWYMVDPGTTACVVSIPNTGGAKTLRWVAVDAAASPSGATTTFDTVTTSSATTACTSTTVSTASPGGFVIDRLGHGANAVAGSGTQITIDRQDHGSFTSFTQYALPAASGNIIFKWDTGSDDWHILLLPLRLQQQP